MCLETIIKRAQALMSEHCAENAFITGNDAMVCLGVLEKSMRRTELYLELPLVCQRLIEGECTRPNKSRFNAVLKLVNVSEVYIAGNITDLKESGRFVYLGAGIWVETVESYLRDNDVDFLTYIQDHIKMISTE